MTAISGLVSRDGSPLHLEDHEAMMAALVYRSAGVSATWRRTRVMLSQQGEGLTNEAAQGPYLGSKDRVVVGDVRLDNRDALLPLLCRERGPTTSPISDHELVLRAYELWGPAAPAHLLGDFAFAIWDEPGGLLFCATDAFSIKPIYFFVSLRLFAFATEVKALLPLPMVPRRLNEVRLADYLAPMLEDTRATLYQDIHKLAPAHTMTVTGMELREQRYWSLDPGATITMSSDGEYAEAFRAHFTTAVAATMRTSGRVGSTLSGGLDSSSIVSVARQLRNGPEPLPTFSGAFEISRESDEREFIDAVVADGGVDPHYVQHETGSVFSTWGERGASDGEPIWDAQTGLLWSVADAAHQAGVSVLLSGYGGDSVVSHGFGYLTELAREGHWLHALSEAAQVSHHVQRPLTSVVRTMLVRPVVPTPLRRLWRVARRREESQLSWTMPLQKTFAARIDFAERYTAFMSPPGRLPQSAREEHWEDLTSGHWTFYLAQSDRVAASRGVEYRYPFLDRRLVEFCLALPGHQKLAGGLNRAIMRRALADLLPPKVRSRGWKTNLGPSVVRRLLTLDRPVVERVLAEPGTLRDYVDTQALGAIYQRFLSQRSPEDGYTIWRAVSLALWLDGSREPVTQAPSAPSPVATMQSYRAYGLQILSEVPLPELVDAPGQADVEVRLGSFDYRMATGSVVEVLSETEAYMQVAGVARYRVCRGSEITIEAVAGPESPALRMFLLGQVFAMLLHQRGVLVLHASAVAVRGGAVLFLGPQGYGKSTSATVLKEAGYSVASDDLSPIRVDAAGVTLLPAFPQIKLWPETLRALGRNPDSLPRLHPAYEKRAHRFTDGFSAEALPVTRLYILGKADESRIEAMSAGEAVVDVLAQSYAVRMRLLGSSETGPHFQQCSRLAAAVPARQLLRTDRLDDLARFSRLLIADLGDEDG